MAPVAICITCLRSMEIPLWFCAFPRKVRYSGVAPMLALIRPSAKKEGPGFLSPGPSGTQPCAAASGIGQSLEIERYPCVIEAPVRVEGFVYGRAHDDAAICQSALSQKRTWHVIVAIGLDIEDVVGTHRQLKALGDVEPQFQIGQ